MARNPQHIGPSGWTLNKLLLEPLPALDLLDEQTRVIAGCHRRINDLLGHTNTLLEEKRAARAELAGVRKEMAVILAGVRATS